MNQGIKTGLLMAVLAGIFAGVGYLVGSRAGFFVGLAIVLVMNLVSFWFSDKIVLFMYRAKEADEDGNSHLYSVVRSVSERANLPMPRVYIIPSENPNAFATGRSPKHAAIAVTRGIMELLNEKELKGVLAHEMAHIKNRDILISSFAAVLAGTIAYIASMARWAALFGGFGGKDDNSGGNIIGFLVLAILAPILAAVIHMAISRSREYLADSTGAKIIHDPNSLADALQKLSAGHKPMRFGSVGSAHMFIVNPFKASSIMNLFSTHPPMEKRVGRLRSMNI